MLVESGNGWPINQACRRRWLDWLRVVVGGGGLQQGVTMRNRRPKAFISVGALCQASASKLMAVSYLHSLSESCLPSGPSRRSESETEVSGSERKRRPAIPMVIEMLEIFACQGGTHNALPRRETSMTRRLDSSLRSHRTSEAQCSAVCSGLNKTLFASVGPNSHGRGHRFSEAEPSGMSLSYKYEPGRINPNRGLRADETPCRTVPALAGVVSVPPNVNQATGLTWDGSYQLGLLLSLSQAGLVGPSFTAGRLLALVGGAIADHGKQDAQESACHGDISLGFANSPDQPLPDNFLPGVGTTKRDRSLAQGPAQGGVAVRLDGMLVER